MERQGGSPDNLTYQNLLLLGAIAAASAFVVTILIVLVCVGCQRYDLWSRDIEMWYK